MEAAEKESRRLHAVAKGHAGPKTSVFTGHCHLALLIFLRLARCVEASLAILLSEECQMTSDQWKMTSGKCR